jgi:hypothetical protein
MKRFFITILLLAVSVPAFCQLNSYGVAGNMLILSIGIDKTFINNPGFDSWTRLNYNKTENYLMSGHIDISLIVKSYDFGMHASAPYPYGIISLYAGKRLTAADSKISSYLNFEVGDFGAVYTDISPVNYTLTPSQQGKQLQLNYYNTYFGLASKNYLNGLSFSRGKGKNHISFNSGFFLDLGYEPWNGDWEYGYYVGSGKYSSFKGTKVYGVPQLNHLFLDAGLFFGIGS